MSDTLPRVHPRADLPPTRPSTAGLQEVPMRAPRGAVDDASPDVPLPWSAPQPPGTFDVVATSEGPARAGVLWTAHGPVHTPCFMPVGTYAAVKGLRPEELHDVGSQVILANAYHCTHRPGADRVRAWGGLHRAMGWPGAMLTDSGGYQVFSLRGLQRIDEDGVDYQTHFDGSRHRMTPESVLEVEGKLGPDICMILDHCPPADADAKALADAMRRTTAWAKRAVAARARTLQSWQLMFGIVQGGTNLAARRAHLEELAALPFDGLALGGLSVGEPIPEMHATLAEIAPRMPTNKPRYVMGIGTPADLLAAVSAGVDMFDCVIPTRHARNGQLFTWQGKLNIRQSRFRDDIGPVDPHCRCATCATFSRAYLRHLHEHDDPLYVRLATVHNLFFFHEWVATLRVALRRGDFEGVAAAMRAIVASWGGAVGGEDDGASRGPGPESGG